jgi:hypothetical protein
VASGVEARMRDLRVGAGSIAGAQIRAVAAAAILHLVVVGHAPALTLPPESAGPRVVLDTYLLTLVAGDCDTGRKLTTGTFGKGSGQLCGEARVTDYRVEPKPAGTSNELVFATTLTTDGTRDGSVPRGETGWFYALRRLAGGAWRISGGGTGP